MQLKKRLIQSAVIASASLIPAPVFAQSACSSLEANWDRLEKNLASNFASGIGDNSAPRATNRKLEELIWMQEAAIIYEMMKDNECTLPKSPPSGASYFTAALDCSTARLRSRSADVPECRRENWKRSIATGKSE